MSVESSSLSQALNGVDFGDIGQVFGILMRNPPETAQDLRAMQDALSDHFNADAPEVGEHLVAVPINQRLTTDVIVPDGPGSFPVMIYLHGGAWVAGAPRHYKKLGHRFAQEGFLTFLVDYGLAPEHPFPTGYEDCLEATQWIAARCDDWGGDAQRLAAGGDSAGGNLSAALPLGLAGTGVELKALALIYGAFDFAAMVERARRDGASEDPVQQNLHRSNRIAVTSYLGEKFEPMLDDPRVSPVRDVSHVPPCHIVCGELDPLEADARAYAAALQRAGIEHELFIDSEMPHGDLQMEMLPDSRPAFLRMIDFLKRKLL